MDVSYTPPAPGQVSHVDSTRQVGTPTSVATTTPTGGGGSSQEYPRPESVQRPEAWQPMTPLPPWQQPGASSGGGGVLPGEPPPHYDPSVPTGRQPVPVPGGRMTVLGFTAPQWAAVAVVAAAVGGAGFYFGRRSKR